MILSIDPGVNNCGMVVADTTGTFEVKHAICVKNARKFTPVEKEVEKEFNTRVVKVQHILDSLNVLLDTYPDVESIAIESPFYSALTPLAYGSLMEVISAIKYNILVPRKLKFRMIEPLLIKRMFINSRMTKGMTKKEVMREFLVTKIKDGHIIYTGDVDALSEHEVDAVAIGFVANMFKLEEEGAKS